MGHPAYTPAEARTRQTFLALMWALSYPGRAQSLPEGDVYESVAMTLLDLETSYFTLDVPLAARLATTGARALPPARAAYHFYPVLTPEILGHLAQANPGTMLYPDEAATLVIGAALGQGSALTLMGPGIAAAQTLHVSGVPEALWALRERWRFPMGWDIYLISDAGQQVVGLPRSTRIAR